jgi:hypothetical protein
MRARPARLALLFIVAIVALSCRSSTEPSVPVGTFTGQWKGQLWEGEAHATLAGDQLFLFGAQPVNAGYMPLEVVRISVDFHGVGTYVLDSTSVTFEELIGGDVVGAAYSGVGPGAGVLEVTSYGGLWGTIEGTVRFDARLTRNASSPTIRFENGHFRATAKAATLSLSPVGSR